MASTAYIYRVFPPEIASNTHDFEVRWVVHNGTQMRGIFAKRRIGNSECSLYVGLYPGYRKSREETANKVTRFAARHFVDEKAAIRKACAYNFNLQRHDPGYRLDPTDEEGNLLPEFTSCIVCYLNEPPPESLPKAVFVYNQPRQRYEVWLLQAVEQDEEVFLYYGKYYLRDYPFNNTCDGRFFHYIPADSILAPDRRGIPVPLQVSEQDYRHEAIQNSFTDFIETAVTDPILASQVTAGSSGGTIGTGGDQVGITPINLPREANNASGEGEGPGGGEVASGEVRSPGGDGVTYGTVPRPGGISPGYIIEKTDDRNIQTPLSPPPSVEAVNTIGYQKEVREIPIPLLPPSGEIGMN